MTNLERRALLGDRQAQEECTRKGVVLPCPCCGGREIETKYVCGDYWCECVKCGTAGGFHCRKSGAIAKWNTRQALLLGRCVECKHRSKDDPTVCNHPVTGLFDMLTPDDFCSYFEPKDSEENAKI